MTTASGIFVTATDTAVGKTWIACLLALELRRAGIDVGVSKPFGSGGRPDRAGRVINPDARLLARFAATRDDLALINPVCLRAALAPADAAAREGVKLDTRAAIGAARRIIRDHTFTLVEGCGGLLVPLAPRLKVIDLIARLALPALLVARAGLGTLNHTLLSVEALRRRNIPISAIVLNRCSPARDLSLRTNAATLRAETGLPVFGPVPCLSGGALQAIRLGQQRMPQAIPALAEHLLER